MKKESTEKLINIRTSVDIHKKIHALATIQSISLNEAVNRAIEDYIDKHKNLMLSLFGRNNTTIV
jgi:predicted HicB family RNase H-like nuclease